MGKWHLICEFRTIDIDGRHTHTHTHAYCLSNSNFTEIVIALFLVFFEFYYYLFLSQLNNTKIASALISCTLLYTLCGEATVQTIKAQL